MDLQRDICHVRLWLCQKFEQPVYIWVERHYEQSNREIADVTALLSCRHPDKMTPAAKEAFRALGYEIRNSRAAIYGYPLCMRDHSRHEALHAYARIEAALRRRALAD